MDDLGVVRPINSLMDDGWGRKRSWCRNWGGVGTYTRPAGVVILCLARPPLSERQQAKTITRNKFITFPLVASRLTVNSPAFLALSEQSARSNHGAIAATT